MAKKHFGKFMVVIIFIFIKVQANDLTATTFYSSPLPISLSHPSKLDNSRGTFLTCLDAKFKDREEKLKALNVERFAKCILGGYQECTRSVALVHDPEAIEGKREWLKCLKKHTLIEMAECMIKWLETTQK